MKKTLSVACCHAQQIEFGRTAQNRGSCRSPTCAQADHKTEGMTGIATRDLRDPAVGSMLSERDALRSAIGVHGTVFLFAVQSHCTGKGRHAHAGCLQQARPSSEETFLYCGGRRGARLGTFRGGAVIILISGPCTRLRAANGNVAPVCCGGLGCAADVGRQLGSDNARDAHTPQQGLPQLFSRFNGASADLCQEGSHGFRFDPTDSDDFARVMNLALSSPLARTRSAAVDQVVEHYSPDAQAERAMASIQKAIAARARSA